DLAETNGGTALLPVGFVPAFSSQTVAGQSAATLDLAALPASGWLQMPNEVGDNGGSLLGRTNSWTIVMDVKFPALASDAGLLQTDPSNADDAEIHVMGGPGVQYEYYEVPGLSQLPDFDALTPVATGTVGNFDLTPRLLDDDFCFRFRGRIRVPADGSYTFHTTSDDGSQLLINGVLVVDNDGLHSQQTVSAAITLNEGTHDIEVRYFEQTGDQVLNVEYEGPGIARQVIPSAVLTQGDAGALRLGAARISDPGAIEIDKWHRLAFTCEASGPNLECRAYLDGVQTTIGGAPVTLIKPFAFDGDYSLAGSVNLFTDDNGETVSLFLNSVSYWGGALTAAEIAALGSPVAAGLPDLYVTNSDNTGPGSLRSGVSNVRDGGLIFFDFELSGQTILLGSGGAMDISGKKLEIDARHLPAKPAIDGADSYRIFNLLPGTDLTIRGLILTRGKSIAGGGAIRNEGSLRIEQCVIMNSDAANGGALINASSGSLTIIDSTLSNNTSGAGGGVTNAGTAWLERCTISGNVAGSSGGVEAINTTTLVNCTVALNQATGGGGGGLSALGSLNLINSTVSGNESNDPFMFEGGGGVLLDFTATLTTENSIIAGNTSNVLSEGDIGGFGLVNELANNLTTGDPVLSPLGNYGGLTQTMPPAEGSPAAGGGSPTANTPATDQRGLPRIAGNLDLGAVETNFLAGADLYDAWANANLSLLDDTTFNGDPDGDGVENGSEYAFRMDPKLFDRILMPLATGTELGQQMQIVIPIRNSATDLVYTLLE
ncbi:MAG: hypothetical protein GWO24_01600, partial [Akkermansiaceae bacterium]|nr:hypothetical protein [Akkermansiaceae bacterium]